MHISYGLRNRNDKMLNYFIEHGCNVDSQDTSEVRPLMLAVMNRKESTIEQLLNNDTDVFATDSDGRSIFDVAPYDVLRVSRACEDCNILRNRACKNCVYLHISKTCKDSVIGSSSRILRMIVGKVNDEFSRGKLKYEWLLNARDLTKLVLMIFGSAELTRFVLENGLYPIEYRDESTEGCTALHCAVVLARLDNAKILVEHGANVDALDDKGCSPLYYYSPYCHGVDEKSELLISLLRSSNGLFPPNRRHSKSVERLLVEGNKSSVNAILLTRGIDIQACLADGETLLTCFVRNRNRGILDLLDELDINFDPNERNDGYTILAKAVKLRCPIAVEFLLRHGADVNMLMPDGKSAIMHGKIERMGQIVELLLQYGSRDAQLLFNDKQQLSDEFSRATRVIIAHLALLEAQHRWSLTDESWRRIQSKYEMKAYFKLCAEQLEQMKDIKVQETVSLYELLTESDYKLTIHARDREFVSALNGVLKNWSHLEPYYLNLAKIRLSRGRDVARLRDKVAPVIETLTGISADVYHAIVHQIIEHLDRQDLYNLYLL